MKHSGLLIICIALFLRVGLIFFDKAKTNYEKNQPISIYKEQLGNDKEKTIKVGELEDQLANAYEQRIEKVKIDNRFLLKGSLSEKKRNTAMQKEASTPKDTNLNQSREKETNPKTTQTKPIPTSINLPNTPFYSQAPDGNRNEPYQNACEEASILLAYYYVTQKNPNKATYKSDLLNLMTREQNNLGHHKDTTIDEFLVLIHEFLGRKDSYIIENPSYIDIKRQLAEGNIIIAPFRGRMLGNPHYSGEGPEYHVMVIKGYDKKHFITHDVGTSNGSNRTYPIETIMAALSNGDKKELYNYQESKIIVMKK